VNKQLGVVFAVVFVDLLGFGIVLPLLPTYAAAFHVSPAAIGFLVTSFSLLQLVAVPVWGAISDRFGRRPVLIVGLVGSTASYVLFAVAGSYWALLVSRIVAGAMGATIGVAQAYIADITAPERRAHAMGILGAAFAMGFILGPALGGILSTHSYSSAGVVAAALCAANALAALAWLPETPKRKATRRLGRVLSAPWRRRSPPASSSPPPSPSFTSPCRSSAVTCGATRRVRWGCCSHTWASFRRSCRAGSWAGWPRG